VKIGETTLRMWSKILKAVPQSRLFLKEAQLIFPYHRERIMKALDVAPERVLIEGSTTHGEHLKCFDRVDLALDPYPIAGGVSMLEGLWQGVPAIVRRPPPGARVVSLVGLSALETLGMRDFIAESEDDYVRLAVRWAYEGRDTLASWRVVLRQLVFNSPLIQGYVESVEAAYRDLFRAWCKSDGLTVNLNT
jgi:protein O-GlcNAc transferase